MRHKVPSRSFGVQAQVASGSNKSQRSSNLGAQGPFQAAQHFSMKPRSVCPQSNFYYPPRRDPPASRHSKNTGRFTSRLFEVARIGTHRLLETHFQQAHPSTTNCARQSILFEISIVTMFFMHQPSPVTDNRHRLRQKMELSETAKAG